MIADPQRVGMMVSVGFTAPIDGKKGDDWEYPWGAFRCGRCEGGRPSFTRSSWSSDTRPVRNEWVGVPAAPRPVGRILTRDAMHMVETLRFGVPGLEIVVGSSSSVRNITSPTCTHVRSSRRAPRPLGAAGAAGGGATPVAPT